MTKVNQGWLFMLIFALGVTTGLYGEENQWITINYDIQLDTVRSGFDKETCWVHPRAGTIPGATPIVVMTMQKLLLSGSDVFYALNEMRTDNLGKTSCSAVAHHCASHKSIPRGYVLSVPRNVCWCPNAEPAWATLR